jgi:hypothetical protein
MNRSNLSSFCFWRSSSCSCFLCSLTALYDCLQVHSHRVGTMIGIYPITDDSRCWR